MAEYAKPWLSVDEQIDRLAGHRIEIGDRARATSVLQAVGYYRLTGYLYPYRKSEQHVDDEGRTRLRVLSDYRAGTTYRGMHQRDAEEIALAFRVPTKKIMTSWLASLNYVRNVAAHHSRLFNRKLQHAPARPNAGQIPVLDHLRDEKTAKGVFGTYDALAVIAYILPSIDADSDWAKQLAALLRELPASHALTIASMGSPQGWESLDLWRG